MNVGVPSTGKGLSTFVGVTTALDVQLTRDIDNTNKKHKWYLYIIVIPLYPCRPPVVIVIRLNEVININQKEFVLLFLLSADLHPSLLHYQSIFFHNRAFTEDAPATTEFVQGFEEGFQVEVRFGEGQVILLPFRSILNAREVDMQILQGFAA